MIAYLTLLLALQQGDVNARLIKALEQFIPHVVRQEGTPGLNLALARGGKVIWEAGFGYANLEQKIPMTPKTVTHSGSMGKTYTATAVMQLVERGYMKLDEPINTYIKDFQVKNPLGGRDVTVRDLLTHRSGLAGNTAGSELATPKPLGQHLKEDYAKPHFEWYGGNLVPRWSAKAGEKYQYSNFGIATLGYLVEVTNPEKLSFSDYVQKHIIDPLGMTSTQYPPVQDQAHIRPEIWKNLSTGYAKLGPLRIPTPTVYFADFPAGAVVTTPGDHIRVLLAYMNRGSYNGYQLLRPETVDTMLSVQVRTDSSNASGLVWFLRDMGKPTYRFYHAGAHMFGWNNIYLAYPNQDFAVAVFTNQWPIRAGRYADALTISNFISEWLEREAKSPGVVRPEKSWTWKTSYVAGLIMVEQLKGYIGIPQPMTTEAIEAMARGGALPAAENGVATWDEDGFRTGVADLLTLKEFTPKEINGFLKSDRLKVLPEELELLHRELGGTGSFTAMR
jgi:CubicO group peptidase (beta-lactamase class C family)